MATYYSQADGPWSTLANWNTVRGGGGSSPASVADMDDDTFVIQAGHEIEFDVDMSGFSNGIAGLTIEGHATTPGTLYSKHSGAGTYYLMIKTGTTLAGTTVTNRGRLLANSDGVWGNTGALPFNRTFVIDLKGTAYINASNLDIQLYDTEPTYERVYTYKTKQTVTGSAAADTLTKTSHGWANGTALMFKVTGGSLPAPLEAGKVYYVVNTATDTFKVAGWTGGTALDLTTDGSGTIEAYDGHTDTGTGQMNVLTDVTSDAQWAAGAAVVLVDVNAPQDYDQQRTTLSVVASGTITLAANVDSAQFPGAAIILVQRNIAIRNNGTSITQPIVDWNWTTFTGSVLRCEIRNTAGSGTTFYGYGTNTGVGHTISGSISGCTAGVGGGGNTSHTISGSISGCNIGVSGGSHTVSGNISGCNIGVNAAGGLTISGNISGCYYAISFVKNSIISGNISGCLYGISGSRGLIISGNIFGCTYALHGGAGHAISGSISGCNYGFSNGSQAIRFTGKLGYTSAGSLHPNLYDFNNELGLDVTCLAAKMSIPPTKQWYSLIGQQQGLYCEDYNQVVGASYAFLGSGDVIRNTTTVRTGGATSSIEVVPNSDCAALAYIEIFEWTEFEVPASAQTRAIYIKGEGWSTFPTAQTLYFEAEYFDAASGVTKTVVASTAVLTDNTTWTKFSVNFTPGQVGVVRYRAYLKLYAASCKVYVDNQLYTS